MKSVLISIRPEWCGKIASGEKTVEVRKTRPKLDMPFKCYIYCTNIRPFLVWGDVFRGDWFTELPGFQGIAEQKRTKSGTFSMGILLASLPATGFMKFGNEESQKILIIAIYRPTNGAMTILQPKLTPYPPRAYQKRISTRMEPERRFCTAGISPIYVSTIRRVI